MIRSKLKFAGDAFPSPNRITEWEHYWQYIEHCYPRGLIRPTGLNTALKALARVDEGRWVADCPWGCGVAFNLPENAKDFWCTECIGGGLGLACALVWPEKIKNLTTNLESLPDMLQYWPCAPCSRLALAGLPMCESCSGMSRGSN